MRYGTRMALLNLLVVGASFAVGIQPGICGELTSAGTEQSAKLGHSASATSESRSSSAAPAAGMTIHLDPQTGQPTREATEAMPLQLAPDEEKRFSTSHSGLVESLSPVAGGGVLVDLQPGRLIQLHSCSKSSPGLLIRLSR